MENQNIKNFPRYEHYKDSGVDWIGEIPEHWKLLRLGSFFSERRKIVSDIEFPPLSVTMRGIVPQLDTAAKSQDGDNRKLVCMGDFVINSRSDRKGSSGVSPLDGSVSLINIVLEPHGITPKYTNFLFKNYTFIEEYYRIGRGIVADLWTTRYSEMKNIMCAFPPLPEQTAIAQFLDYKTAQIDRAIAIKEEQIKLLNERKQIMIQEAVTKGLDPTVPMKDSGVEWIGEIPKHWNVLKLKYLLLEKNIRSTTGEEELLSLSQYRGVIPRSTLEDRAGMAESLIGYKKVFKTNLVINRMQAANGLLAISNYNGITSPDYAVYREIRDSFINLNYVCLLLRLPRYLAEFKKRVTGAMAGFIRLYTDDLYAIKISVPSFEEQNKIVAFIDMHIETTTKAITYIENQIQALKEYKTTLINEAVTGKIKVN